MSHITITAGGKLAPDGQEHRFHAYALESNLGHALLLEEAARFLVALRAAAGVGEWSPLAKQMASEGGGLVVVLDTLRSSPSASSWRAGELGGSAPLALASESLAEALAERAHDAWREWKRRQGYHAPGHPGKDGHLFACSHCHKDLVPYAETAEGSKEASRRMVRAVLSGLAEHGLLP